MPGLNYEFVLDIVKVLKTTFFCFILKNLRERVAHVAKTTGLRNYKLAQTALLQNPVDSVTNVMKRIFFTYFSYFAGSQCTLLCIFPANSPVNRYKMCSLDDLK